ncbi:MAG: outer membrane protein assembly factor BamB, partial [Proteobacteria bacterium]|nr:outer membrane protein assembly factor BamB [Pseudomonadota bacterium]
EGYVHVLSSEDGSFVARAKVDSGVHSAPVDIGPGFAVETTKGNVVAFRLK